MNSKFVVFVINLDKGNVLKDYPFKQKFESKMTVELVMQSKQHGFIGLVLYTFGAIPVTDSKEDKIAFQRVKDFYFGWLIIRTFLPVHLNYVISMYQLNSVLKVI